MVKKRDIALLAKSLYIKISEKELDYIVRELKSYEKQLLTWDNIDLEGISSITFPFDSFSKKYQNWNYNNLRNDNIVAEKTSSILKDNCLDIEDEYVVLPKVL